MNHTSIVRHPLTESLRKGLQRQNFDSCFGHISGNWFTICVERWVFRPLRFHSAPPSWNHLFGDHGPELSFEEIAEVLMLEVGSIVSSATRQNQSGHDDRTK
jgi:hypothetical protein